MVLSMVVHRKKRETMHNKKFMPSGIRIRHRWIEIPVRFQISYVDWKENFSLFITIKTL